MEEENNEQEIAPSVETDDVEALKEERAKLLESNKRLFARAKVAESEVKNLKGMNINNEKVESKPTTAGIDDVVLDLRLSGYSKQEVEFIMKNGGPDALKDDKSLVAIALKTAREQTRAEQAASQTEDKSQYSEIERKFTPEQLKAMSTAELAKLLPHA